MHTHHIAIRKVLLIDDDLDDFLIFEAAIKEVDPSIEVSHISALDEVTRDGNCTIPDILFLDINMPDQNGFEWLKCIRERGYDFPIVMYSTASNPAYVEKAYQQGADVYFPKPESFKKLQESLYKLLQFNWLEPYKVREDFCGNGQYRVFSLVS
jgi:DNA-binding NarL/FixJ family response regulator